MERSSSSLVSSLTRSVEGIKEILTDIHNFLEGNLNGKEHMGALISEKENIEKIMDEITNA